MEHSTAKTGQARCFYISWRLWIVPMALGAAIMAFGIWAVYTDFDMKGKLFTLGIVFMLSAAYPMVVCSQAMRPFRLYADSITKGTWFRMLSVPLDGAHLKTKRRINGKLQGCVVHGAKALWFHADDPGLKPMYEALLLRLPTYDSLAQAHPDTVFEDAVGIYRTPAAMRSMLSVYLLISMAALVLVVASAIWKPEIFRAPTDILGGIGIVGIVVAICAFLRWLCAFQVDLSHDRICFRHWPRAPKAIHFTPDTTLDWEPHFGGSRFIVRTTNNVLRVPTSLEHFDRLVAGLESRFPKENIHDAIPDLPFVVKPSWYMQCLGVAAIAGIGALFGYLAIRCWRHGISFSSGLVLVSCLGLGAMAFSNLFRRTRIQDDGIRFSRPLWSRFVHKEELESIDVRSMSVQGTPTATIAIRTHGGKEFLINEMHMNISPHALAQALRRFYGL